MCNQWIMSAAVYYVQLMDIAVVDIPTDYYHRVLGRPRILSRISRSLTSEYQGTTNCYRVSSNQEYFQTCWLTWNSRTRRKRMTNIIKQCTNPSFKTWSRSCPPKLDQNQKLYLQVTLSSFRSTLLAFVKMDSRTLPHILAAASLRLTRKLHWMEHRMC